MQTAVRAAPAATELPGRYEAEWALRTAMVSRKNLLAAAFVIPEFQLIELHLGMLEADGLLIQLTDWLTRRLPQPNRVFRWTAGAVVALIDCPCGELDWLETENFEEEARLGDRRHRLPFRLEVRALPVPAPASARNLFEELDRFAAGCV